MIGVVVAGRFVVDVNVVDGFSVVVVLGVCVERVVVGELSMTAASTLPKSRGSSACQSICRVARLIKLFNKLVNLKKSK